MTQQFSLEANFCALPPPPPTPTALHIPQGNLQCLETIVVVGGGGVATGI